MIAGVDGSEGSLGALRWALEDSVAHAAEVHALIVWSSPYTSYSAPLLPVDQTKIADEARNRLDTAVEAVLRGGGDELRRVPLVREVVEGTPARALLEYSAGADLLVVGSRGLGGFRDLLLGSVSTQLAHHSRCPLVIVPGRAAHSDT